MPSLGIRRGPNDYSLVTHLPKLFDRFFRADPARANSGESSGIGLAIVKTIMDLHHGTAQAESTPGQVTCFRLVFPGRAEPGQ